MGPSGQEANGIPASVRISVASGTRAMTVLPHRAPVRLYLKCCIQVWSPHDQKDMEVLECVHSRERELGNDPEHKADEEGLREVGMFRTEKKGLRGHLMSSLELPERRLRPGGGHRTFPGNKQYDQRKLPPLVPRDL